MLRQLLVRAGLFSPDAPGDSNELSEEEFKLPKMTSLVIIITYNIIMQVRNYAILVHGSMV